MEAQAFTIDQPFQGAYEKFIEITSHLSAKAPGEQTHSDIEAYLETDGRELLRLLLQDHLDQQGPGRVGEVVHGSDGVVRSHKRDHMETGYQSVFGAVRVARTGYRQRGVSSLFPRDAQLNLPVQSYSHRLQKRVAAKAAKMSFESAASDIETETGVRMGTRQMQEIVDAAAQDFDGYPCARLRRRGPLPQARSHGDRLSERLWRSSGGSHRLPPAWGVELVPPRCAVEFARAKLLTSLAETGRGQGR